MYVYHGSVENGSLKKMCCLSPKQQAFYFHRFEKKIHGSLGQALSTEPRSNKSKARWRFPPKKTNRRFRFKISVVCIPSIPRKASCIFWGKHLHRLAKLLRRKPIQLTMRIPDTCCCSDVPRHTCSRWKWEADLPLKKLSDLTCLGVPQASPEAFFLLTSKPI